MLALLSPEPGAALIQLIDERIGQQLGAAEHSTETSPWLTVAEAADSVRTSSAAIYKRIKRGQLRAHRPDGSKILVRRLLVVECLMQPHHGKRRLPVEHRGRRVPNLYRRPKSPADARNGDTFEVICRDETGRQRLKTLQARTVQRAVAEAEEYRTQIRRGELTPRSRVTVSEVAHDLFGITDSMVGTGQRSQRTLDLYRQRYEKHIAPTVGKLRIQDVRAEHIGTIFAKQRKAGSSTVDDDGDANAPDSRGLRSPGKSLDGSHAG